MPIIKSAIKRVRQNKVRYGRNLTTKQTAKTAVKSLNASLSGKDTAKQLAALTAAISAIDKAAKRNVIHKNKAARQKSQLTNAYNKVNKQAYGATKSSAKKAVAKPAAKKSTPKKSTKK